MNLLSELNREGATIVMVTHSDRDAGFAHRTIQLLDGQVVPSTENQNVESSITARSHEFF